MFFNQEKQVRESPGLGKWGAEKENPCGPSAEARERSLQITLARQASVQRTVRPELTKRIREHSTSQFLVLVNLSRRRYTLQISERD